MVSWRLHAEHGSLDPTIPSNAFEVLLHATGRRLTGKQYTNEHGQTVKEIRDMNETKKTYDNSDIRVLIGKTLISAKRNGDEEIEFVDSSGDRWKMFHAQDCCESVTIEDINGDLDDLAGTPILDAYEESNGEELEYGDHETWTFYRIITAKGTVVIRWYGTSNGYYSESADFGKVGETWGLR